MKTNHKLSIMQLVLIALCAMVLAGHRYLTAPTGMELFCVALASAMVVALGAIGVERLRCKLQLKPAIMDKAGFALLAGAGFLFLLAAGFTFLQHDLSSVLKVISALFAAACGAVTLMRLPLRDSGETAAVYALVPIFYLSFYLLVFYRSNGDNPALFQFGYEIAVILVALLGIYAAVAGRFEKARPRFRAVCCSLGLLLIGQELCYLLLNPGQVLSIPGFSPATAVTLAAFALLLCCGLCYPPVRDVFPIVEETQEYDETPSDE